VADVTGLVALVTGGIPGIGLAICERLMNRGVRVAAISSSCWMWSLSTTDRSYGTDCIPWLGPGGMMDAMAAAGLACTKTTGEGAPARPWSSL
jgi:hypothetical protein